MCLYYAADSMTVYIPCKVWYWLLLLLFLLHQHKLMSDTKRRVDTRRPTMPPVIIHIIGTADDDVVIASTYIYIVCSL